MEHEIVRSVAAAQKDAQAADALVRQYLPFIKAETAKFLKRIPVEGKDDEFGIAMFAFHEAAMAYQSGRGSFLKLAAAAIRNRLIDYQRMEQRHAGHISLDQTVDGDAEGRTLLETIDTGHDEIAHRQELGAASGGDHAVRAGISAVRPEADRHCRKLPEAGTDAGGLPPRAVLRAGASCLFGAAHCNRKAPHRRPVRRKRRGPQDHGAAPEYLVALLLAFTNGFEIIRGHLRQMARPVKEVK